MPSILIKNGRIWDGDKFFYGDILTENQHILRIADKIDAPAGFIFDATGMTVSAGLVDAHVHMTGPEPNRYGINPEMSTIPFGVTAAADAGGACADQWLNQRYLVKNVTFVTVPIVDNVAQFTTTERKLQLYGTQAIGLKVYFDTTSSGVLDIKPLQQICTYARSKGLKVMVHCSHSPVPMADILETLSPGDILTHSFHGAEHTAAEDHFAAIVAAKARGIVIDAGFAGHIHTDFAVLRQAIQQGVLPDTISTDITQASAYMRGGRYGMTMCMSMARTAGMDEEDIFRAVTTTPAAALGKAGCWGQIAEGGCADLTALAYTDESYALTDRAGNCLSDTMSYRCKLTIVDGVVVWRD